MSLPAHIIAHILSLADLPIDTRLNYNIKPRKLVLLFPKDIHHWELLPTIGIIMYDSVKMRGRHSKPYPEDGAEYNCSHHIFCDYEPESWLCHAEYHAMYHNEAVYNAMYHTDRL